MFKAFTYMFKDNKFLQKAGIVYLFSVFVNFMSLYANGKGNEVQNPLVGVLVVTVTFILFCIFNGYGASCTKAIIEQKENIILPFIGVKNNLRTGIKLIISYIPLWFCIMIPCLFMIITTNIGTAIFKATHSVFAIILCALAALLFLAFIACFIYYTIALWWIFVTTNSWKSFIRFKYAHELISRDWKNYAKYLGLYFLIALINTIWCVGVSLSFAGKTVGSTSVIASLLIGITTTYFFFVYAFISAKAIKKIDE